MKAWHIPTIVTPVNSKVIGHPVAMIQLEMHVAYAKLQFVQFLPCYVRNSVYYLYYVSSILSNQKCSVCSFSGRKIFSDEKIHGHTMEYILAVSIFKLECRS